MPLTWADRLLRRLLQASMFVVALLILAVVSPPLWHNAERASTWQTVSGVITESSLVEQRSRRGRSTCVELKVTTVRSGSDPISLSGAGCFLLQFRAMNAQRQLYQAGASVQLLQNPDNPRQITFLPGSYWSFVGSVLLGLAALAYAIRLGQRPTADADLRWSAPVVRTAAAPADSREVFAVIRTGAQALVRLLQALLGVGGLLLLVIAAMSWQERYLFFTLALSLLCAGVAAWLQRFVSSSSPRP